MMYKSFASNDRLKFNDMPSLISTLKLLNLTPVSRVSCWNFNIFHHDVKVLDISDRMGEREYQSNLINFVVGVD